MQSGRRSEWGRAAAFPSALAGTRTSRPSRPRAPAPAPEFATPAARFDRSPSSALRVLPRPSRNPRGFAARMAAPEFSESAIRRRAQTDAAARGGSTSFAAPAASRARRVRARAGLGCGAERARVGLPAAPDDAAGFAARMAAPAPALSASAADFDRSPWNRSGSGRRAIARRPSRRARRTRRRAVARRIVAESATSNGTPAGLVRGRRARARPRRPSGGAARCRAGSRQGWTCQVRQRTKLAAKYLNHLVLPCGRGRDRGKQLRRQRVGGSFHAGIQHVAVQPRVGNR